MCVYAYACVCERLCLCVYACVRVRIFCAARHFCINLSRPAGWLAVHKLYVYKLPPRYRQHNLSYSATTTKFCLAHYILQFLIPRPPFHSVRPNVIYQRFNYYAVRLEFLFIFSLKPAVSMWNCRRKTRNVLHAIKFSSYLFFFFEIVKNLCWKRDCKWYGKLHSRRLRAFNYKKSWFNELNENFRIQIIRKKT